MAAIALFAISITHVENSVAAEQANAAPLWVFTKFKEAKTPTELNRLTIGLPQSTDHLLETECKLAVAKQNLAVTLNIPGLKKAKAERVQVKFFRQQFEQTLTGTITETASDSTPAKVLINIRVTAPLWNALMGMKGLTIAVDNSNLINFNLVRGSEQRVSNFLQSCRAKSLAISRNQDAEKNILRQYYCKDGSILKVKLIASGTQPTARLTHNDAEDIALNPEVSAKGIIYQNDSYKLEMRGFEATLKNRGDVLTCSANLPQK